MSTLQDENVSISIQGSGIGTGVGLPMDPPGAEEQEPLMNDNTTPEEVTLKEEQPKEEESDEESSDEDDDRFKVKFLIEPSGPKRPMAPRAKQIEFKFDCASVGDWELLTPDDMRNVLSTVCARDCEMWFTETCSVVRLTLSHSVTPTCK